MEEPKLTERIKYWLNNRIAGGTGSRIMLLFVATVIVVLVASVLICLIDPSSSWHIIVWNNTTTAVNKWMPEVSDEESIVWVTYIIRALVAIAGLFITGTLIGILGAGIESKIDTLRNGKRRLLEKNHIVILGAVDIKIYLNEIQKFAGDSKYHVLIADELDGDSFEEILSYQKEYSKHIKLYVKNIDIGNIDELELCSIQDAMAVIIQPENDDLTVRSVIAVSAILDKHPEAKTTVVACVNSNRRMLPKDVIDSRITMVPVRKVATKLMMRCCSKRGLSEAMIKFLSFSNASICREQLSELNGRSFGDVYKSAKGAVPMGIQRGDKKIYLPSMDMKLEEGDHLLYIGDRRKEFLLEEMRGASAGIGGSRLETSSDKVVIIGYNPFMGKVFDLMPVRYKEVVLMPRSAEESAPMAAFVESTNRHVSFAAVDPFNDEQLLSVIRDADQIILSVGTGEAAETIEADNIVLTERIRSLSKREGLHCTTTLALQSSKWMRLGYSDDTVAIFNLRTIRALILMQAALNAKTRDLLFEILDSEGHELSVRRPDEIGLVAKEYSVKEMRQIAHEYGIILVGLVIRQDNHLETILNPSTEDKYTLTDKDDLIVFI